MVIGIDIGGSTTDAVALLAEPHVVTVEANHPLAAAAGALARLTAELGISLHDVECLAATGGGARHIGPQLLGVPVETVPEFTAIGIGGTTQAGLERALVVSLGTGTALVAVQSGSIVHVGGTGVGGGTLLGLSKHLLQVSRIETIEQLAARGELSRVDLSVGDIAGGPLGDLPADATASNFGKLDGDPRAEDKATALVNMIAEVVVAFSVLAARATGLEQIVLTGKLLRVRPFVERVQKTRALFGREFLIPPFAEFATAIGAARAVAQRRSTP
jgi:type II pantothenate kinase